jgi:hypothetical protein
VESDLTTVKTVRPQPQVPATKVVRVVSILAVVAELQIDPQMLVVLVARV